MQGDLKRQRKYVEINEMVHFNNLNQCVPAIFKSMCNGPAVSSVAKRTLSVRKVWDPIPGPVKLTQCRQRLAAVATFLRSCVAQALSRGDGPCNSLHGVIAYGKYNEDLILF